MRRELSGVDDHPGTGGVRDLGDLGGRQHLGHDIRGLEDAQVLAEMVAAAETLDDAV